jgi:hypothetical protein
MQRTLSIRGCWIKNLFFFYRPRRLCCERLYNLKCVRSRNTNFPATPPLWYDIML